MSAGSNVRDVPKLIAQLYQTVQGLNKLYPARPFTPDGHLVGSIGEVVAADTYDLRLEKCSNPGFDAKTQEGQTVEITLTGGASVSLSSDCTPPDFLIVLKLNRNTGFNEIYNGEFPVELWKRKSASKRRAVSLRLKELQTFKPKQRLGQVNPLAELNQLFVALEQL
jgi:hypothetical protein